jgi:multidrug resistance efflux pump
VKNMFKNFNIIYIIWLGVFWICYIMFQDITGFSHHTFFGSAEVEGQVVNSEYAILIQKVLVKAGQNVHKGDTLAFFARSDFNELNRRNVEKTGEIKQFQTEKQAKLAEISQEMALLEAKKAGSVSEVESQIKLLELENGVQTDLRKLISTNRADNPTAPSNLRVEKIKVLQASILQIDKQINQQKVLLEAQIKANQVIYDSKIALSQQEKGLIQNDQKQFVLIAPVDGFIETVSLTLNQVMPARQDLVKINPAKPTRVRGFLSETGDLKCNVGDTIELHSVARPKLKTQGIYLTGNPSVTEMPLRLRRYTEIKSWGREIFIQLPDTHRFYIGEKIMMKPKNVKL